MGLLRPFSVFMTRNNLADHLSWLLSNSTKPAIPILPHVADPSSSGPSRSQLSEGAVAEAVFAAKSSQKQTKSAQFEEWLEPKGHGSAGPAGVLDDKDEVIRLDGNMARLTSSSKSRKPLLVSRPQQLLTPASTTAPEHAARAQARSLGIASRFLLDQRGCSVLI